MANEFKIKNGAIISGSITGITEPSVENSTKMASTEWVRTYVANSGAGTGTVTSVALSVPTGLSVSGSPITTTGTFDISLTSGYSIPTTSSQINWDAAYLWGNHASAGYLTASTAATTYVPLTRTITINGTSYDLSADRSWTIAGTISGLTTDYLPKATGANTLGNSLIYDSGSGIGIGKTSLLARLDVAFTPSVSTSILRLAGTTTVNDYFAINNATSNDNVFVPIFQYKAATYGYNGGANLYVGGVYGGGFIANVDDGSYPSAIGAGAAMHFSARNYTNTGALNSRYLFSWANWTTTHMAMTAAGNLLIGTTTNSTYRVDISGTVRASGAITSPSFVRTGGTAFQFLKADGGVDSNTYLTSFTETDPTVPAHVKAITATNISNWNTAFGWGNHASAGYLTTSLASTTYIPLTRTLTINGVAFDLSDNRSWTVTSMVYPGAGIAVSTGTAWGTSITDNSTNWNTAYSWGNHALAGYLTTASAASTYLPLSGGTLTGGLIFSAATGYNPLRITGGVADYYPAVQDGAGRVNWYWNKTGTGGAPTFQVSSEDAIRLKFSSAQAAGGESGIGVYYAAGSTAGAAIVWTEVMGAFHNAFRVLPAATFSSSVTAVSFSGAGTGLTGTAASLSIGGNAATVTSITSGQVTTALGYTPYNSTNPSGYTTNTGTVTSVALSVPTGLSVSGTPITTSGTLAITLTAGYSIPTTTSQTNWDSAFTERRQWDGGSTNLVAATGRTSLGATTVGSNLFTLTNPTAVTFIRINADNTVSTLDAATFRTAIGAGTSSTTGTVTSVSGTGTVSGLTLTGTVTTSGSLTLGGTLSLTSANVTGALGYTPYNNTNPNGYITQSSALQPIYGNSGAFDLNVSGQQAFIRFSQGTWVNSPIAGNWSHVLSFNGSTDNRTVQMYLGDIPGAIYWRPNQGGTWHPWERFLTSNNYNSYSPTLTGGGASGTWGISVTGNAATVTNGLYTNNYSGTLDSRYFFDYGFTTGYPGTDANTMPSNRSAFTYANNAPLTGCIAHFGAAGYGIQLNGDYTGDSFSMRSRNGDNATWRPWKRLLTDYNYTAYSPTLTGGGASGTWGINVTGSAGFVAWTGVTGRPTALSSFTNDSGYITSSGSISGNAATVSSITNITGLMTNRFTPSGVIDALTTTNFRTTLFGTATNAAAISTARWNNVPAPLSGFNAYGTMIAWGASDTQGFLAVDYAAATARIGGGNGENINWSAWLLHSSNYNSYSPTLTGGGASGTWGISVTGSAGSVAWTNVSGRPTAVSSFTNDSNYVIGGSSPTFTEVYANNWFRNNGSNEGLYNEVTTQHLSSNTNGYWDMSSTTAAANGVIGVRLYAGGHVNTYRGAFYSDGLGIGILNNTGGYALICNFGVDYGGKLSGAWNVTGAITQNGNQVLHAGNYTSYLTSYVPYTGATGDVNLGTQFQMIAGGITASGYQGGSGVVNIKTGTSRTVPGSGYVTLFAEDAVFGFLDWVSGNTRTAKFSVASITNNTTKTYTLPNANGTLALTSDIPTANNGTLTMNVSGVGLSGSQTFTANQATAATFTVTSNATSVNTVSTIVARDASGNFSAGTITASLSGNASSASSVAWTGVTGRPTALSSFTNDSGYITSASVGNGTLTMNVSGTGLSGSASFTANQSGAATFTVTSNATSANTASTIVARDASGNFTAGAITVTSLTETSSIRYKENVIDLTNPLDKVTKMRGVSYNRKGTFKTEIGVIAEEIADILPEVITSTEDGQIDSVSYGRLTAVLIEAVKEQQKQINELKELLNNK